MRTNEYNRRLVASCLTDDRITCSDIEVLTDLPPEIVKKQLRALEASGDALNTGFGWVSLAVRPQVRPAEGGSDANKSDH